MAYASIPNTPLPSEGSRRIAFANQTYSNLDTYSIRSSGAQSSKYERKPSVFIFDHISDIKVAGLGVGEKCNYWLYGKIRRLSKNWFVHCFLVIVMILYTVGGALIFLTVEGQNETKLIERDIELQVKELLDELRRKSLSVPEQFSEKEWLGEAARRLVKFEKIITQAFQQHPLVVSHTDGRVWTIWNAVVYCSTLYTTIGYGHLYPTTFTGRVLTMVYSTIGIPLFLIVLTDFGKLFTTGIKFFWSYIRRFYYTRSCRRVRKTHQVQEIMKGAQVAWRRVSVWGNPAQTKQDLETPRSPATIISEPQTPAISSFEIDDEFNLPVSLALTMLVAYMLIGAAAFMVWEEWDFFSSFYFVFMSMSTIGFGDIVPGHPIYMILSILYLCFGLALMSMCINVVQDKLSESFSHASAKIGETIGIDVEDDENAGEDEKQEENDDEERKSDNEKELLSRVDSANGMHIEESPFKWSTAQIVR